MNLLFDCMNFSVKERPKSFITGAWLKWVAMITMFIDHFAASGLYFHLLDHAHHFNNQFLVDHMIDGYYFLRFIGRIAFPIFCFLLVEGYAHTRSVKKYITRLFVLALISEVPFDLAFSNSLWNLSYQNVFFTLGIGLTTIWILDRGYFIKQKFGYMLGFLVAVAFAVLAELIKSDYGAWGVALIVILWLFYHKPLAQAGVGTLITIWEGGSILLSYLLIYFYNGKQGKVNGKIFYLFYPLHLLLYIIWRGYLSGEIGPWQFPH